MYLCYIICIVGEISSYKDLGVREYWIVDPTTQTVLVYFFEQDIFNVRQYTFQDKIKVNIYDDLWIDFKELGL